MRWTRCLCVFSQSFVAYFSYHGKIIQLMHSYEVNIRICQPENRGLTNPDVNRKRMHQLFCYITLHASLFLVSYRVFSYL